MVVITKNGKTIFVSSSNVLRIYKTNNVQLITLNPDSLGKNNFPLHNSLANAHFWAYIKLNDLNNNGFIDVLLIFQL